MMNRSIQNLTKQINQSFNHTKSLKLPLDLGTVFICGMGGSQFGGHILKALNLCPITLISDYSLPKFYRKDSFVVIVSYSGDTEEAIECAIEALTHFPKNRIFIVTSGGKLGYLAQQNRLACYLFDTSLNPAKVPRSGLGYMIGALLGLFATRFTLSKGDIKLAIDSTTKLIENYENVTTRVKTPLIIAAEHLAGNAHILRNQFNETSKVFASYSILPELNHHLMEGITNKDLQFIILDSNNYSKKIKDRLALTIEVINKNGFIPEIINLQGKTIYEDIFRQLLYGSYLTYNIALQRNMNPTATPYVDWFKEQLKVELLK